MNIFAEEVKFHAGSRKCPTSDQRETFHLWYTSKAFYGNMHIMSG